MVSENKSYLDLVDDCDRYVCIIPHYTPTYTSPSFPYSDPSNPHHADPYAQFYAFYLPSDPRPHGYLLPATVASMPWTEEFAVDHDSKTITLNASQNASTTSAFTTAFKHLIDIAISSNRFKLLHGEHSEPYPIIGARVPVSLERYAAPLFGIISRGAHLTVYTRGGDDGGELKIWVPRRSKHLFTYPNCLDTTVAGGVTAGEGPFECVVREAGEEASLDEQVVRYVESRQVCLLKMDSLALPFPAIDTAC